MSKKNKAVRPSRNKTSSASMAKHQHLHDFNTKHRPEKSAHISNKTTTATTNFKKIIHTAQTSLHYIPTGIKLITSYLLFLLIIYGVFFFANISKPTALLLGVLFTGTTALLINVLVLSSLVLLIDGFVKRKKWCFDLAIAWFTLTIINAGAAVFSFGANGVLATLILLGFLSILVMHSIIIWYILHEKRYFYAKTFREAPWQHRDKVLVYTLITFWVISILLGATLCIIYAKNTLDTVDTFVVQLYNTAPAQKMTICERSTDKDLCYVVAAAQETDKKVIPQYCARITSDLYKFTCLQTLR